MAKIEDLNIEINVDTPELPRRREASQPAPSMRDRLARLSANGLIACLPPQFIAASVARITPAQERAVAKKDGSIAVVPMRGVVVPREDRWSPLFGEFGAENTAERVRVAAADPRIKAIVLDIDSPGGNVLGVTEAANAIRAARGKKPIVAHADWTMASAAYWMGCAADEIVASPSATVGAVGILSMFVDETKMLDLLGVKITPYAKPDDKGDGWGMWPNTDKFDARMKQSIADAYKQFVDDIAASRTIDRAAVLEDWAFAYEAKRALLLGMVDKVRPMSETFAAFSASQPGTNPQTARNKLALLKHKGKN